MTEATKRADVTEEAKRLDDVLRECQAVVATEWHPLENAGHEYRIHVLERMNSLLSQRPWETPEDDLPKMHALLRASKDIVRDKWHTVGQVEHDAKALLLAKIDDVMNGRDISPGLGDPIDPEFAERLEDVQDALRRFQSEVMPKWVPSNETSATLKGAMRSVVPRYLAGTPETVSEEFLGGEILNALHTARKVASLSEWTPENPEDKGILLERLDKEIDAIDAFVSSRSAAPGMR